MRSQLHTGEQWIGAQYNSNNGWIYNGNNGNIDNNNKNNSYEGRRLDYETDGYTSLPEFLNFATEMQEAYKKCRKNKRNKKTQLEFEYDSTRLTNLTISIWENEYIPKPSIAFIITEPRTREVIAADFADRVAQTWFDMKLKPHLEEDYYDEDTYSCRKGKGGLKAVFRIRDLIYEATNGYIYDATIIKRDMRAFFMSIDTELLEKRMTEFINMHFGEDSEERNRMLRMARIIYRSTPQHNCIKRSNPLAWNRFEKKRSLIGKNNGLPLGNPPSQTGANFMTGPYLQELRRRGYGFAHYTDDTCIIRKENQDWKQDEKEIGEFIKEELHLEWHETKKYMQHFSKGVEFLGFKIKHDRILPSDRITHNLLWKTECAIRKAERNPRYATKHKEDFMSTINSYMGLLKWCDSTKLRRSVMEKIKASPWNRVLQTHGEEKVTIRKEMTRTAIELKANKKKKKTV